MKTVKSEQYDNPDLTKNKSITITAVISAKPYICVASNVPGSGVKEYTTTLYVMQSVDTTTEPVMFPSNNSHQSLVISKYYNRRSGTFEYCNFEVK